MTRMQEFQAAVNKITLDVIKANMPEPKMLTVDICFDLPNAGFTWAWDSTRVASGLQKEFIATSGFEVCKKSEASLLMIIGEKDASINCWIIGKYKKYWVKPNSK